MIAPEIVLKRMPVSALEKRSQGCLPLAESQKSEEANLDDMVN